MVAVVKVALVVSLSNAKKISMPLLSKSNDIPERFQPAAAAMTPSLYVEQIVLYSTCTKQVTI